MNGQLLLIRADANSKIGFGHVMRCIALAQYWLKNIGPVSIASTALPGSIRERLKREGLGIELISSAAGSTGDAIEFSRLIASQQPVAVVVDGYEFGSSYQIEVQKTKTVTLVIDDFRHLGQYHADILLNQNVGVDPSMYVNAAASTELLLGSSYALVRSEFLDEPGSPPDNPKRRNVLVTLGGFDPGRVTQKIVDAIELLSDDNLRVTLVSPIEDLRIDDPRIDLVKFSHNMAKLMTQADIAICAGGSTNWEMSFFGIPRVVVVLADNQREIATALEKRNCVRSLGWYATLSASQIAGALDDLLASDLEAIQRANRTIVDGRGAGRVAQRLLAIDNQRVAKTNETYST